MHRYQKGNRDKSGKNQPFCKKDMDTWKRVNYQEPIFELFRLLTVVHLVRFACLSRHYEFARHDE